MSLSFLNVSHAYDDTAVLSELNLSIDANQITCLLGPSGSGKSTLLRLAAGLENVQAGRIELGGELLASAEINPPPEARPVGLMFQDNALFPNMSVAENIAFGIQAASNVSRQARVSELLDMIGLSGYAERYPHQLSGGQQQRITLARSIAAEPQVLLMDEPYASIDVTLRGSLREAARLTLKANGMTSVLVTHDPYEAMEMADVIAVLDHGRIMQIGTPQQLFEQPAAVEVAQLFGAAQTIKVQASAGGVESEYGRVQIDWYPQAKLDNACCAVVRPEGLTMSPDPHGALRITDLRFVGEAWLAHLLPQDATAGAQPLRALAAHPLEFELGDSVSLNANPSGFYIFDKGHEINE